jgi:chromate reductase, NAD(P)H dehydrogenase (quinone)
MDVLAIAGSLRKGSFNRMLINTIQSIAPQNMRITPYSLGELPLYNEDLIQGDLPKSVEAWRTALHTSQALIIASPEYSYSIPGVLKNALDWAGTNALSNLMQNKVVAIMGATPGSWGTARAQLHLRQVLHAVNARVVSRPEVYIRRAKDLFTENGILNDERTIGLIKTLLENLVIAI